MKVYKSPIFYVGVLLLIAVLSALLAPVVIDWNSYRADLENYGRKLTGRAVAIEGPVSARLFPWPRLTVEDIRIANPPGFAEAEFGRVERLIVRMSLAGLFQGNLQVESIDIENPEIGLEYLESGRANLAMAPEPGILSAKLLAAVRLDRINLHNARLRAVDRRRAGVLDLEHFDATLSTPALQGPWRLRGTGELFGQPVEMTVNTNVFQPDEPFEFGLRVSRGALGPVFILDGGLDDGRFKGLLRIEPSAPAEAKSDPGGELRPLALQAEVDGNLNEIAFDKIEILPHDPRDGGSLLTGSAKLSLGANIRASVAMSGVHIDVDALAGAQAGKLVQEGGYLGVLDALLKSLPERTDVKATLKVSSLRFGGDTLENVALDLAAFDGTINVRDFSASLPGRSRAKLSGGLYIPGSAGLNGRLDLETGDLRQLVRWLSPSSAGTITRLWTGSRGRLKLVSGVSLTHSRFVLRGAKYELDGLPGAGDLSISQVPRTAVDLRLDAPEIDIDSLLPKGIAFAGGGKAGFGEYSALLLPGEEAPEFHLTLQAGKLLLNGTAAQDVAIDVVTGAKGIDLRALAIGSVGGARLEASGLIVDAGAGAGGSIGISAEAEDPLGLLRLAGLLPIDRDPAWTRALGASSLTGKLKVETVEGEPQVSLDLTAKSGDLAVSGELVVGAAGVQGAREFSVAGKIESATSASLVRLLGLEPAAPDISPGTLKVIAAGGWETGFISQIDAQLYGARLDYDGRIETAAGLAFAGQLAIRSTNLGPLALAAGAPTRDVAEGNLVLDAALDNKGARTVLTSTYGRFGESDIALELSLEGTKLGGNIEAGEVSLLDVMAASFLDWSGRAASLESGFAEGLPFGITGELWIKPKLLRVNRDFAVPGGQIGIMATAAEIRLAASGKTPAGRDLFVELASRGEGEGRKLEGRIALPVDLARALRRDDGASIADGEGSLDLRFDSRGRSPAGAIAALDGSGSYAFHNMRLLGLSPERFTSLVSKAKDMGELIAAFEALRQGDGLAAGEVSGSIAVVNGVASFLPFTVWHADADIVVKTVAELGLGEIDTAITLKFKARPDIPAMEIAYAGPPDALVRGETSSELVSEVGYTIMEHGVKELERLQKEEERLAAEEERARKDDEAKLVAYYAQRDELRLRQRELGIHGEVRVAEAERLRQTLEATRGANAELTKKELSQRQREIRIYRRLARLAKAAPPVAPAPPPQPAPDILEAPLDPLAPLLTSPSQ